MRPVYPRWRGEHGKKAARLKEAYGLSPLARGTRYAACLSNEENSVYPRWRGEHRNQNVFKKNVVGLSPLARGTLAHVTETGILIRFIPAGAGNTAG